MSFVSGAWLMSYCQLFAGKNRLHQITGKGKGNKGGKKKKGYMKIFMIGAALKAKLEMLLKLLSFHLQLKFFAIAAIGLIVNIARFWLDVKKGQAPQKVSDFN